MKNLIVLFAFVLMFSCNHLKSKHNVVETIQINTYENIPTQWVDSISKYLTMAYNKNIEVNQNKQLPENSFVNIKTPRYRADSIIKFQKKSNSILSVLILGVTKKDISTTKRDKNREVLEPKNKYLDWGVMGLAYVPGNSCVISSHRIQTPSKKLFYQRLTKIAVHEVGHNFGLNHCKDKKCVMSDALETIKTIDNCEVFLCNECKSLF